MFFAWNFLLLWLTEPFPVITLIVRFNNFSLSPLSGNERRIQRIAFVTFCESNAKALLTGKPIKNATCKQVLRPAGGFPSFGRRRLYAAFLSPQSGFYQQRNIAMSIIFATLQSSRTQFQDCKILIPCIVALLPCPSLSDFIQFPIPSIVYPLCMHS